MVTNIECVEHGIFPNARDPLERLPRSRQICAINLRSIRPQGVFCYLGNAKEPLICDSFLTFFRGESYWDARAFVRAQWAMIISGMAMIAPTTFANPKASAGSR